MNAWTACPAGESQSPAKCAPEPECHRERVSLDACEVGQEDNQDTEQATPALAPRFIDVRFPVPVVGEIDGGQLFIRGVEWPVEEHDPDHERGHQDGREHQKFNDRVALATEGQSKTGPAPSQSRPRP